MTPLSILLITKIVGTLFPVALPMLLAPRKLVDRLSGFNSSDIALYRLYAVAILALLTGYAGGLHMISDGIFPEAILYMGLVSNAGATVVLITTGRARKMPWVPAFFGAVAIGLAFSIINPDLAMHRI